MKIIKEYGILIIGCILMALATSFFLLPNKLSSGGFGGLATIIYYWFSIPLGITMLILNIPLFIFSKIRIGTKFFLRGIIGTIFLSLFIDIFDGMQISITHDKLLACVYGGVIMGIGTALVLKANSSTGGTEMLAGVIKTYTEKYRISNLLVIIDTIVVVLNVLAFREVEIGLYSAITIYIMGKMIDIIFEGINFTKAIFVISDKYEEIAKFVGNEVQRGSTAIYAKGMFTKREKNMLFCVASRSQIGKIKKIIEKVDDKAFIVITDAREAFGKGFR